METWIAQLPAILAAIALLMGLGALLVLPFRVGRLALVALAPVAGVAVIAVLAIVYGWIGVPWSLPWILAGSVAFVAIMWAVSLVLGRAERGERAQVPVAWILLAGLAVGVILGALRIGFYIGDADAVSQTNDAVFHLNALRYAQETGDVSSFGLSAVIGSTAFYPAAWHAVVLAVAELSGADLPAAINAVSLVISTAIWVPGIAWLTREAMQRARPERSIVAAGFAGALAPALLAFPLLMLQWGVLYPNALSVALIPAAATLVLVMPEWSRGDGMALRRARPVVVIVMLSAAAVAIGLAQPAGLLAWLLLAVSILTWNVLNRATADDHPSRLSTVLQLAAVWGVGGLIWFAVARTGPGSHWGTFETEWGALLDLLTNGLVDLPMQIVMSVLMVVGLIFAVRVEGLRWLATGWLGLGLLYFVAAAIDRAGVRDYLIGPWYADPYRLAALLPLVVVPLAAVGLTWIVFAIVDRFLRTERRAWAPWGALVSIAAVGGVLLVTVPVTQLPLITEGITEEQSRYAIDDKTYLSTDERELLERLPEILPPGSRVIGNPSTGMGFAFALSGVDAIPRTWSPPSGDDWTTLAEGLRDVGENPEVCDALAAFDNPEFVIDFGPGETTAGRFKMPGFTGFAGQPGFELVDSVGDASVWRITAC
ncbi:DUF6541 family protein [Microbacterium aurugineum]|uniref:DUF6541 family protein n=1 Tax=Microbacterium aurugineum TaxID=2851642 RepID=UPI0020BED6B8|nr:DUF6541 family protein [Microbacterium aurugineum]MCK8477074.1 hypothetical protein [Microbacterium aurugineum]